MNFKKLKRTYIIAEIGVNHNGSLNLAKKLILNAKKAGADAVKFQTFKTENLAHPKTEKTIYQKKNTSDKKENHFQMLQKLELDFSKFVTLKKFSKKLNIGFISTPYDVESAKFLKKIGLKIIKVSSADLVDVSLNKFISSTDCSVILSLGMANMKEINKTLKLYKNKNKNKIALLHCVSNYPCKLSSINLSFLKQLKKMKYTYGFSDHSLSNLPAVMTIAMGGKIIEKHFTLNKKMTGPDHRTSLDFEELKKFINDLRESELILGKNIKICQKEEINMKNISRKSIIAKHQINKGEKFNYKNLGFKRPGKGLSPLDYFDKIIGKRAKFSIRKEAIIKRKHF